jgi:hypothetical protein
MKQVTSNTGAAITPLSPLSHSASALGSSPGSLAISSRRSVSGRWQRCSLVAVLALTVGLTGGKPLLPHSSPSTAAIAVKLAIGVGLILFGEPALPSGHDARVIGDEPVVAVDWQGAVHYGEKA